jgi:hypothetical protein
MLKCKEASQLVSRALDEKLSMRERIELKFHLFICKYCSTFNQQLKTLTIAISKLRKTIEDDTSITLPKETKSRIAQSFESEH